MRRCILRRAGDGRRADGCVVPYTGGFSPNEIANESPASSQPETTIVATVSPLPLRPLERQVFLRCVMRFSSFFLVAMTTGSVSLYRPTGCKLHAT